MSKKHDLKIHWLIWFYINPELPNRFSTKAIHRQNQEKNNVPKSALGKMISPFRRNKQASWNFLDTYIETDTEFLQDGFVKPAVA